MEEQILALLGTAGKPLELSAIAQELGAEQAALEEAAQKLLRAGRALLTRRGRLALPEQTGMVFGRIQGHARGFGFFKPADGGPDAFVPADGMHGAMHGDSVWVRLTDQVSRNGSPEAEVCGIAQRAYERVVGTFEQDGKLGGYVVPDDARLPMDVLIPGDRTRKAQPGDKVVAEVLQYPDGRRPILGAIVEVLGNKDAAGTDVLAVIRQFQLPEQFSKGAARQAKLVRQSLAKDDYITRESLKEKCVVTIDGADSRDFDDAISLERLKNGNYYLGVHIADVSAYVKEGSALDRDALGRGTSVYFPDRVIPMLPEALSNGICSLNEGVDRLTLSCFMELDAGGKVVSHRLAETVIRSRHRLVYEDITKLLLGDEEQAGRYADILPMMRDLETLAGLLGARRAKRGSIDFDLDETKIALDDEGRPVEVGKAERGIANRIIEECMLIANETVAQHVRLLGLPFLYRVHETPDKEKIAELNTFLQTLGYGIRNARELQPRALQRVLLESRGTKEENIVSKVVLRAMKRARYCEAPLGHFGLAAKDYCHFTSPIRRYPDLMVHRILKELMHGELNEKRIAQLNEALPEIARVCSERERTAAEAERAVDELKKCEYMKDRVGERCAGVISGVTSFGFFVELGNTVEGLVRMSALDDDYYVYDEKNYCIAGRGHGKVYRLGDEVTVRVAAVNLEARNIDFDLYTQGGRKPELRLASQPEEAAQGRKTGRRRGGRRRGGKAKQAATQPAPEQAAAQPRTEALQAARPEPERPKPEPVQQGQPKAEKETARPEAPAQAENKPEAPKRRGRPRRAQQPKQAESKAEAPKQAETKAEAPKQAENKPEAPKQAESKPETPKQEPIQQGQPKAAKETAKPEAQAENKPEAPKRRGRPRRAQQPKPAETKAETPKPEKAAQEPSRAEQPKAEPSRAEPGQGQSAKPAQARAEEAAQEPKAAKKPRRRRAPAKKPEDAGQAQEGDARMPSAEKN